MHKHSGVIKNMCLFRFWSMESLWAWMKTLILFTLLTSLLLAQGRHLHTTTKLVSMASALPLAMEACSTAVWNAGFRTQQTPVWWRSLTASTSTCRGHRASRPATCIPVPSTASPASAWCVPHRELYSYIYNRQAMAYCCLQLNENKLKP